MVKLGQEYIVKKFIIHFDICYHAVDFLERSMSYTFYSSLVICVIWVWHLVCYCEETKYNTSLR